MTQGPAPVGTRSPDGRWWWDGQAWQPVPPGAPGQVSPYVASGVTGEPGRVRSIGVSILLAIVTLGIYTYVWVYKTHTEIKRATGIGIGGALGFVVYFVLAPVTWFLIPSEVRQAYQARGMQSPVRGILGLWILLPLIGMFVWFFKVQGALNRLWEMQGAPAAR